MIRWIYAFIDRPLDRFEAAAEFWTTVTGSTLSARRGGLGEFATLLPADGDPCLKLQGVHTGGGAHLDLAVTDVPAAGRAAEAAGSTLVADHGGYAVHRSPAGQLFCFVPWHGEAARPAGHTHPDGDRSRLDQVCVDIAPSAYDTEVLFWQALTGWTPRRGELPEFRLLRPDGPGAVQILLQRLATERPGTAHLDLACSDVASATRWHQACGASPVGRWPHWQVMRDPAGGTYCLTRRTPH